MNTTEETVAAIKGFIAKHGYPPTLTDLGEVLKLSSRSSVWKRLRSAERQGYISVDHKVARGIRVLR